MERYEFVPAWKELCASFGRDVTRPGTVAMGEEYFKRFQNLSFEQFVDLCEAAKDSCDDFPSRKELVTIAANKHLFERGADGKPVAVLTPIECTCGHSFVMREADMQGFATFDCPGKSYVRNGAPACNRSYDAGYLSQCKRSTNGVIWIGQQPAQDVKYPTFLKD